MVYVVLLSGFQAYMYVDIEVHMCKLMGQAVSGNLVFLASWARIMFFWVIAAEQSGF